MPRFLAIDFDQNRLHLVAGSTSRKGAAVEKTLVWELPKELTAATGEELGKALRDALKGAGIPSAPVLASVGRDRVILKELRFPNVPEAEVPALVRFQTAKELTENPDDVVIDYSERQGSKSGERQAVAMALKKSAIADLQALCRGAGLKLLGICPRPYTLVGTVRHLALPTDANPVIATVLQSGRWAELTMLRGDDLLLSRSITVGAGLPGDVKRSLGVIESQHGVAPRALFVSPREILPGDYSETVGMPLIPLDPFKEDEPVSIPSKERGPYAPAVGLLELWAIDGALPINFVHPKAPKIVKDPGKSRKFIYAGLAAAILIFLGFMGRQVLANKEAKLAELKTELADRDLALKGLAQISADIQGYKDWEKGNVPWLDEFYDLTARFPWEKEATGFHLSKYNGSLTAQRVATGNKVVKEDPNATVAQLELVGISPTKGSPLEGKLTDKLDRDPHLTAIHKENFPTFTINVDIAKQEPKKYEAVLVKSKGAVIPEDKTPAPKKGKVTKGKTAQPKDAGAEPAPPAKAPMTKAGAVVAETPAPAPVAEPNAGFGAKAGGFGKGRGGIFGGGGGEPLTDQQIDDLLKAQGSAAGIKSLSPTQIEALRNMGAGKGFPRGGAEGGSPFQPPGRPGTEALPDMGLNFVPDQEESLGGEISFRVETLEGGAR